MSKKIRLECDYCGVSITEKDHKCPNCGANCSYTIKKYQEQQEKEKEEAVENVVHQASELQKQLIGKSFAVPIFAFIIITFFFIFFISIGVFSYRNRTDHIESEGFSYDQTIEESSSKVEVSFNETAVTKYYSVILDSYELYEYSSSNFPNVYNTPDGYQKIAFHFVLENLSGSDVSTYSSFMNDSAEVGLRADDYVVDSAHLMVGSQEYVVSGNSKYPEFNDHYVKSYDKLQGYVGFLVPKNAKKLKFTVGPNVVIVMDNPVYQE